MCINVLTHFLMLYKLLKPESGSWQNGRKQSGKFGLIYLMTFETLEEDNCFEETPFLGMQLETFTKDANVM